MRQDIRTSKDVGVLVAQMDMQTKIGQLIPVSACIFLLRRGTIVGRVCSFLQPEIFIGQLLQLCRFVTTTYHMVTGEMVV